MPKVCQDMHKCHNCHAILYTNCTCGLAKIELRLYLNRAKNFRFATPPPLNTPMRPLVCDCEQFGFFSKNRYLLYTLMTGFLILGTFYTFLCFLLLNCLFVSQTYKSILRSGLYVVKCYLLQ